MTKYNVKIIDRFKYQEKNHENIYPDEKVNHQYILYDYTDIDEKISFHDLISCLEKIPNKVKLIEDHEYIEQCKKHNLVLCYIVELMSYTIKNNKIDKNVGNFKLKFVLIK